MEILINEELMDKSKILEAKRTRVLIVEDDKSLKPFWLHIIDSIDDNTEVKWMTTQEGAEYSIKKWSEKGQPYDLVICDIFLSGEKTGIDLWKESIDQKTNFILTSVVTPKRLDKMLDKDEPAPTFLQKPLDVDACKLLIKDFLLPEPETQFRPA